MKSKLVKGEYHFSTHTTSDKGRMPQSTIVPIEEKSLGFLLLRNPQCAVVIKCAEMLQTVHVCVHIPNYSIGLYTITSSLSAENTKT